MFAVFNPALILADIYCTVFCKILALLNEWEEAIMKITWLGHACFKLETADGSVVFDPFSDGSVAGLDPIRESADLALASHGHGDHAALENVSLSGNKSSLRITAVPCFHDDEGGAKRGKNIIHIVESEGLRVAHFGDLGHMLSAQQLVQVGALDAAMIPVGGFYTIDAKMAREIADKLPCRVVIPMHYRSEHFGFPVLAALDEFCALSKNIVQYDSNTLLLTADTPAQTAILRYGK